MSRESKFRDKNVAAQHAGIQPRLNCLHTRSMLCPLV